jgi:hypothetical protein
MVAALVIDSTFMKSAPTTLNAIMIDVMKKINSVAEEPAPI